MYRRYQAFQKRWVGLQRTPECWTIDNQMIDEGDGSVEKSSMEKLCCYGGRVFLAVGSADGIVIQ